MRLPLIVLSVVIVAAGVLALNSGVLRMTPATSDPPGASALPLDPESTVGELFADHFMNDMGFTPQTVARKRHRLTPDLYQQIEAYFARPADPNEAPAINGDPFTNTQEYPSSFEVREGTQLDTNKARVPAIMTVGPEQRTVQVDLVHEAPGWLVDDLVYEDGSTFRASLKEQP